MWLSEHQTVMPLEWRAYPEWHKGRTDFYVWYIEITSPSLIAYCQTLRQEFSAYLHPHYQRQFHITLFVNGFLNHRIMYDDDILQQQLQQQIDVLQALQLPCFDLTILQINSFASSLFVTVESHPILTNIRNILNCHHVEIAPSDYQPHITLGFYHQAYQGREILQKIQQTPWQRQTFHVEHLTLGYYHAQTLQGKLYPVQQIKLGNVSRETYA